jgi:hypothetical protein
MRLAIIVPQLFHHRSGRINKSGVLTYLNPQTGHEVSAVLGFTYNCLNRSTQYQNGVDLHLDRGASQFLTQQVQVGVVGYVYKEVGCDSESGDRVGCFQSQVLGIGPQPGFVLPSLPVPGIQGYARSRGCQLGRDRFPRRRLRDS